MSQAHRASYDVYCLITPSFALRSATSFGRARPLVYRAVPSEALCEAQSEGGFGLVPFRSPLLRKFLIWSLFLWVLKCFTSPGAPPTEVIPVGSLPIKAEGFPH